MKIAVIGGGASGVVSAIKSKKDTNEVVIFERNNTLLKKLLMTGNGRCNYFNDNQDISNYYSNNKELIPKIINKTNINLVLDFFNSLAITPKIENGWYYPRSMQAITIKEALVYELERKNIKICLSSFVEDIKLINNKFILLVNDKEYTFDKIILATGGMAYPKTGSDGYGYSILKKINHTIIKPLPALVQLIGKDNFYKKWDGIRVDATLTLYENNKEIKKVSGNLQLTNYGLSGICSMQLSNIITRGLDLGKKEEISINFLDYINNFDEFNDTYQKLTINSKKKPLKKILDSFFNYKLVNLFFSKLKLKDDVIYLDLDLNKKKELYSIITNFRLEITSTKDFTTSQTTSGGVSLTEINLDTMESLKIKNLYITGELLDINGDCGGYNLTLCWISGIKAGNSIND